MLLTYKYPEGEICEAYAAGRSSAQVAVQFGCAQRTVINILERHGIQRRSRHEANALRWAESDFRENQISKRQGKPSGALGKSWTIDKPVRKPNLKGEKNPNWQNGKTSLTLLIRALPEYRLWRRAVFERDQFKCQSCGVGGKVEVDHVYPFSRILRDFKVATVEDAVVCTALWCLENGKTLCRSCHKETPTYAHKLAMIR